MSTKKYIYEVVIHLNKETYVWLDFDFVISEQVCNFNIPQYPRR